eukprot:gene18890-23137_t
MSILPNAFVVANAGIEMVEVPVTDFTEEQFDKVFSINTKGSYFTLQQAARNVEDNGRIIYIASSTTSFPVPGIFVEENSYPALRKQLLDSCPMGRLAEVEDVANVAEFFASDLSSFVHGHPLLISGG